MPEFTISTSKSEELVDITGEIQQILSDDKTQKGFCLVYTPHSTAAVMVMEADGAVEKDVLASLSNMVPKTAGYNHKHGAKGHGASHVKSSLFGPSRVIPIIGSKLALGTWQRIVFCEFDGPRERRIVVETLGSEK